MRKKWPWLVALIAICFAAFIAYRLSLPEPELEHWAADLEKAFERETFFDKVRRWLRF
jgi:hypothetical protein